MIRKAKIINNKQVKEKRVVFKSNLFVKFIYDVFCFAISSLIAYLIRFDFSFDIIHMIIYERYILISTIIELILGIIFVSIYKTYRDIWQYTSIGEIYKLVKVVILEKLIFTSLIFLISFVGFPKSIFLISPITTFILLVAPRLILRFLREAKRSMNKPLKGNNTLIVGAGEAGEKMIREIKAHPRLGYNVVGFIDDNPIKHGCYLQGVRIIGDINSIPEVVDEYDIGIILIAIPTANRSELKRIYEITSKLSIKLLVLPGIYEIIGGNVTISHLRPFGLEDLLFREQVKLISERSINKFKGAKVLVTGACGSIGSNICTKLVELGSEVIAFDNNETGIFDLKMELNRRSSESGNPSACIIPIVGDIRFKEKLFSIMNEYKPSIVFHAAAYKHVPLMELNPEEAITNNIIGTMNLLESCIECNIQQCILISTDKAVEPKNIMGMSKRVCELMVLSLNGKSNTKFSAVRFGNVLGSRGNVLEIWKKEFEKGEPLSITDPNMKRYFMLTSEAATLCIEATTLTDGGDILLLDMGKEINMVELAKAFCNVQGTQISEVGMRIIGIRSGEKLEEKLYSKNEQLEKTEHKKILRIKSNSKMSWEELKSKIEKLTTIIYSNDKNILHEMLSSITDDN